MSRFSPDTWLDAASLPLAMIQFRANVYIETIAPDVRPLVSLIAIFISIGFLLVKGRNVGNQVGAVNRRAACLLMMVNILMLSGWIFSSANGRYGLFVFFIASLSILGALLCTPFRLSTIGGILFVVLLVQATFLATSNVEDGWLSSVSYRWREAHADKLPESQNKKWKDASVGKQVTVIIPHTNSGMSILYPIFGPDVTYIGGRTISNLGPESERYKRAKEKIRRSDRIFIALLLPEEIPKSIQYQFLSPVEVLLLRRFGVSPIDETCEVLAARMGGRMLICEGQQVNIEWEIPNLPSKLVDFYEKLERKCPAIFGDPSVMFTDGAGGLNLMVGDGKYELLFRKNGDLFVRHRTQLNMRKLFVGKDIRRLDEMTCIKLIGGGGQYW